MKLRFVSSIILGALMLSFLQPALINAQDLGLKLVGTAVSDDPRLSYAVIETQSNSQQKPYREGDQVGEILIKKILLGKVVIQHLKEKPSSP